MPPGHRKSGRDRPLKVIAILSALALVGFIAFVVVNSHTTGHSSTPATFPPTKPSSLAPGTYAPDFSLPRLGGGPEVTLDSTRGKPTILNFFASWCSHCRAELGAVAAVASADNGRVSVIGVDTSDPYTEAAERLLARAEATYPVGVDRSGQVASEYHLTGLPVTYFLDARGKIVGVAFGAQTTRSLDRWVRRLTASGGLS